MARIFEGAMKNWKMVFGFLVFSVVFWLLEFAYQFYILVPGEFAGAIIRGSALAGTTFFAAALFSSSVFKWFPKYAKYWYVRRGLGVMGFVFIAIHFSSVTNFLFQGNAGGFFWSLNPFENPLLFGLLAYPVFFLMALTSSDWAVQKLGAKRWKALHRLVYFGFMFAVFHFLLIAPQVLFNLAGFLMLLLTFLALGGELYWFFKTAAKYRFATLGAKIGFLVILMYLALAFAAFVLPNLM